MYFFLLFNGWLLPALSGCCQRSQAEVNKGVAFLGPLPLVQKLVRETPGVIPISASMWGPIISEVCPRPTTTRRAEELDVIKAALNVGHVGLLGLLVDKIVLLALPQDVDFFNFQTIALRFTRQTCAMGQGFCLQGAPLV